MTGHPLLTAAARNNAAWCDLVCTALGVRGTFTTDLYVNWYEVPRYYPNVITLSETVEESDVVRAMGDGVDWSIKDSFGRLDMTTVGLTGLFEARWLVAPRNPRTAGVECRVVDGDAALHEWLAARDADGSDVLAAAWSERADLAFVSIVEGGTVVGSGVLSEAHGVVGLSNVVCSIGDPSRCWSSLVAASRSLFPGVAVVGYETGEDLSVALSLGCKVLGPLTVWARYAAPLHTDVPICAK
ncbi:MAG: hypothetical protein WAN48_12425 [Actinomycetes bacterium]